MTARAHCTSTCTFARHRISRSRDLIGRCCHGCAIRAPNSKEPTCGSRRPNWSIPPWLAESTVSGEGEEDTMMRRYLYLYFALVAVDPAVSAQTTSQGQSAAPAGAQPQLRRRQESDQRVPASQ